MGWYGIMTSDVKKLAKRDDKGRFIKGGSGNPAGRPQGTKNRTTALRQALELQLREQAAGDMEKVMAQAMRMALKGDRAMIKLLLDYHLSKAPAEEKEAQDKVSITIGSVGAKTPEEKDVITINGKDYEEQQTVSSTDSLLPDPDGD